MFNVFREAQKHCISMVYELKGRQFQGQRATISGSKGDNFRAKRATISGSKGDKIRVPFLKGDNFRVKNVDNFFSAKL